MSIRSRPRRRALGALLRALGAVCGANLYLPLAGGAPGEGSGSARLALLIGNRHYPDPFDLPPVPKNVRDLKAALQRIGFNVTDVMDADLGTTRGDLAAFARAVASAPDDAVVLFYYCGHGAQVASANLLLPRELSPTTDPEKMRNASTQLLRDVLGGLAAPSRGMLIALIDACRTNLRTADSGLNQVEAPAGCLIQFSTGAGRPALAPASEDQNTFYTAELVRQIDQVRQETTFPEMLQLVRAAVRTSMLNHPVAAVRKLAQDPFIADHSLYRLRVLPSGQVAAVTPPKAASPATPPAACAPATDKRFACQEEQDAWGAIDAAVWPADIVKLADAFVARFPDSPFRGGIEAALFGARDAAQILQRPTVRLYRGAFKRTEQTSVEEYEDVRRAGRGDKDAAARQGRRYLKDAGAGGALSGRYEGWLQYAAALGNGIASYELSIWYARAGQPQLQSEFESRATDLGYTPPPTLDNRRS